MQTNRIPVLAWVRTFVSLALTLTLIAPAVAQQPSVNRLDGFQVGSAVKLRLVDGRALQGTIQSREAEAFTLGRKRSTSLRIAYADVASAKLANKQNTGGAVKWVVLGVVLGTVAVVTWVLLVRLHNEGAL